MRNPFARPPTGVLLGTSGEGLHRRALRLSPAELRSHAHVIGVSGSGKSRFLAGLFLALLDEGMPATLIDPDGDLARLVLAQLVAQGRFEDPATYERIISLDLPAAEAAGRFVPFNVLSRAADPHTAARNVLESLRRAWPALDAGQAPTFENIVLAGTYVLVHHRLPLTLLHDLLIEKSWRDWLLRSVPDPTVVRFFTERYDRWARQQPLMVESTLRRIFLLAFSPALRYSLAQPDTLLDFATLFAERRSLIVNLALADQDARRLFGCLLTVSAEQAAFARPEPPGGGVRPGHHLILDEFSEFSAQNEEGMARILSRCRKYGLFLVLAHQTWGQASERLRGALQNAGLEVVFRLGRTDAEHTAPAVGRVDPLAVKHQVADGAAAGRTHPAYFSHVEQWEQWIEQIQDLGVQEAFLARPRTAAVRFRTTSVPDPTPDAGQLRVVQETYLRRYFRPLDTIEAHLASLRQTRPTTTRLRRLR